MPSKSELQSALKEKYGINKNITQPLSTEECEQLLTLLHTQPSAVRLVGSFVAKNSDLSRTNRQFGQQRSQAEKRLNALQAEYQQLEKTVADFEARNRTLGDRKGQLSQEQQALEAEIEKLSDENASLSQKMQALTTQNDELIDANEQLKKDNKDLKNIVDQIRLRLARDTKMLLEYEDSEIRKALIRLFRWTLG